MASALPPGTDLSKIPAGIPPPGVIPNFVNPPSLAPTVLGINITFMVITAIFVSARLTANLTRKRKTGLDDWFCAAAFIGAFTYSGLVFSELKYFRHMWDIPLSWLDAWYFKTEFAAQEILYPTTFFAKLSIFLLYRRVFTVRKPLLYCIYAGILITLLLYVPNVFLTAYFCAPHVGEGWNIASVGGCSDLEEWYVVQAALIVVLDLYIFILPLPTIVQLQIPASRRKGILIVFMTAILAVLAAIAQLGNRPALWKSKDQTWHAGLAILFTCMENYISIIVGSAPAFSCFINAYLVDKGLFSGLYSRFAPSRRTDTSGSLSKDKYSSDSNLPIISTRLKHSNAHAEEDRYINLDVIPDQQNGVKARGNTAPKQNIHGGIARSGDVEQGFDSAKPHGEAR